MTSSWSHLRRPHPRFHLHRLPLEVRLEVFGSLTLREWMGLAGHNRWTKRVLLGNRRYLAPLARLHSLKIQTSPDDTVDITWAAYNRFASLGGRVEEDDEVVLSEIREGQLSLARQRQVDTDCWLNVQQARASPSQHCFSIRLPDPPQTVAELRLIRFWLRALSLASFESIRVKNMFCPQFLAVLFPPPGNLCPLFRCSFLFLSFCIAPLPAMLGPLICAREVVIILYLNEGAEDWNELFRLLCSTWTVPTWVFISLGPGAVTEHQYMIEACRELPAGFNFRRLPAEISCSFIDGQGPDVVPNAKLLRSDGTKKAFEVENRWNRGVQFEVEIENRVDKYSYTIRAPPRR